MESMLRALKSSLNSRFWRAFLVCSPVLLMTLAFSPTLSTVTAQPSDCLTTGCQTYFTLNLSGGTFFSASDVTYVWQNSNPCGAFVVQTPSFPGQVKWSYGPGISPACSDLNGTVTVKITIAITSGTYVFTRADPNGASGADFNNPGPVGVNTCVADPANPQQRGSNQIWVADFIAQQSHYQVGTGPSTTSSTTITSQWSSAASSAASATSESTTESSPPAHPLFGLP